MAVRRQIKQNYKAQITIFIIIAILVISIIAIIFTIPQKFKKAEESPKKIYCSQEQRNADVCIALYEPVCGFSKDNLQIKTYSNSCFACIDKNVKYYAGGECK